MIIKFEINITNPCSIGGVTGIREDIAAYCEKFGDIKIVSFEEKQSEQINFFGRK